MEAENPPETTRNPANIMGLAKNQRRANAPLEVDRETSAWEIYNDRALTIDRELIKDLNDSLNTLLIFAALYSAILTAFIIQSMNLIQEDFTETTRDVLLVITRQLANNTVAAFESEPFEAPGWAVRVNCYFFTAISCTLVAALAAVLALQWVGSYDASLNPSSPEGRALQRQFRHQEVEKWRMVQIIAFLPAFIFVALFLFFIGLAEWMWTIHQGVAGVIIAGLISGAAFFLTTTTISIIHVGAPFRTPASRSLAGFAAGLYYSTHTKLSSLSFSGLLTAFQNVGSGIRGTLSNLSACWKQPRPESSKLRAIYRFLQSPYLLEPFEEREKELVYSITDIKLAALIWLANSIDVLPHNLNHFASIFRELLLLPPKHLLDLSKRRAPWSTIFTLLLDPNRDSSPLLSWGTSSRRNLSNGAHFASVLPSDRRFSDRDIALQAFLLLGSQSVYRFVRTDPGYQHSSIQTKAITTLGLCKEDWENERSNPREAIHFMTATIASVGILPCNLIAAHLLSVYDWKAQLKNFDLGQPYVYRLAGDGSYTLKSLRDLIMFDYMQETPGAAFPDQITEILLDIIALRFSQSSPTGDTPFERYIQASEFFFRKGHEDYGIHDAIITQVVGSILRRLEGDGEKPDMISALSSILRLLQANPTPRHQPALIASILPILSGFGNEHWGFDRRLLMARIYAFILPTAYSFAGEDWAEWKVRFYTGLDRLSQTEYWSSAIKKATLWERANNEAFYHKPRPQLSKAQVRRLSSIRDPILWLYASSGAGPAWTYPSKLPNPLLARSEEVSNCLWIWNACKINQPEWSHSELLFTRALILNNGFFYYICSRLARIKTIDGNPMSSSDWLALLHGPVLATVLRTPETLYTDLCLDILLRVCTYQWFSSEFRVARGFEWLINRSWRLDKTRVANLIRLSLECAAEELDIVTWIEELYHLLVRYTSIGGIRESETLMHVVDRIYSAQKAHRVANQSQVDTANTSSTGTIQDAHTYISNWSEAKWNRWQEMIEAIPDGLRRGCIRVGPSESTFRFAFDPDWFCAHR